MATCNGCGGVVGRDCFNPSECEWIAQDMERREAMQQAESVARDAARQAVNEQLGIGLRDYFAAQVIGPAFLDLFTGWRQAGEPVQEDWPMGLAIDAYRVADAMLRARTKDASHE